MATAITLVKSSPLGAVYNIVGDGAEGTRAGNVIAAELANGPLKEELSRRYAASNMDTLNLGGTSPGRVRIRIVTGVNASIVLPGQFTVRWTATALSATCIQGESAYIEIRFQHSGDR